MNQENMEVNNNISRLLLSNALIDSLHFETDQLNDWISESKLDPQKWANQIETAINLVPKTFVPLKIQTL